MKATFITAIYLVLATLVHGQQSPLVSAVATKLGQDTICKYRIVVMNRCDSILVIPHSEFFKIDEVQYAPIGLALYDTTKDVCYYDMIYSWKDTLLDPQKYPLSADYILPFQKLEFEIAIKPFPNAGMLNLNVFFVYNINYRTFLQTLKNSWKQEYYVRLLQLPLEK